MIEVLKRGDKNANPPMDAICPNCESHLRFKVADTWGLFTDRDVQYVRLKCPVCEQPFNHRTA